MRVLPSLLAFAMIAMAYPAASRATAPPQLRVMTFNVRTSAANDGPNGWDKRRDLMARTIGQQHPDVFGTQELHKEQGDYLVGKLPQYAWFGLDRHGGHDDEHMGVFYRRDRWRVLQSGNFWLSDTPGKPGSISWGNLYPRMVTWALFESTTDGRRFWYANTHFPYRDQDEDARTRCAREIAARIAALPKDIPVVLTGDFNSPPDRADHALLTGLLHDAWLDAPNHAGPQATFHNFTGTPDHRIDWILYRGFRATSVATLTTQQDGRYPSDHFPVAAELQWPSAAIARRAQRPAQ